MKRIAVSQRVEYVTHRGETRDCLDQAWTSLISDLGATILPIPNQLKDVHSWLQLFEVDGVVLTGGNDLSFLRGAVNTSQERDRTESGILQYAARFGVPVLGVCRGMQVMNHYFCGSLTAVEGHAGESHEVSLIGDKNPLQKLKFQSEFRANSFHNWSISTEDLGENLIPLVIDKDRYIEAFKHESLPFWGIMWHPERESEETVDSRNLLRSIFEGVI